MPIRWTVNHAERLVDLALDGEVSQEDATQFFDAIEAAGAIPYRKFVDATNTPAKIDEKILARATQGTHTHAHTLTYPDNTVNCMGAFPTILFRIVFGGWKGCERRFLDLWSRLGRRLCSCRAWPSISVQTQRAEVSGPGQRFPDSRCSLDLARVLTHTSALAAPITTAMTTAPIRFEIRCRRREKAEKSPKLHEAGCWE